VERILGVPWAHSEELERDERKGLVYGLVVSGLGEGDVMPVETSMVPGSGKLILTGSLGDVGSPFLS
jgi:ATP-dependent Lon protease